MEFLSIHVPAGYSGYSIGLHIRNGKGIAVHITEMVMDGIATIDLSSFDAGFFNPFGGTYSLQYFDEMGELVMAGEYDTIQFEVGQYQDEDGELNPFV